MKTNRKRATDGQQKQTNKLTNNQTNKQKKEKLEQRPEKIV